MPRPALPRPAFARWMDDANDVAHTFLSAAQVPDLVNLGGGIPDASLWPAERLSRLAAKVVSENSSEALGYSPIEGLPAFRDLIAERFSRDGLRLTRDNVLITTAGTQALDLVGKVLLNEGEIVAAQSPAYLGALDAWRPRRPRFRSMRIEAKGFDPVVAMSGAKFAYAVPNFSNPTGRMVSLEKRQALAAAARRTGVWLVEDDPYGALQYDGAPLPRILTLSANGGRAAYDGPVVYFGTISKEIAPGLRIGWVIAAPEMIEAMTMAKQGSDMCTSSLSQRIAHEAFATGLAAEMLPEVKALYRRRRDALCGAMADHLSEHFSWEPPAGGMFVWARARDPRIDTDRLMKTGLKHGVCVSPSSVFDPAGEDRGAVRLNFTLNPRKKLEEGVRRLAAATRAALVDADARSAVTA